MMREREEAVSKQCIGDMEGNVVDIFETVPKKMHEISSLSANENFFKKKKSYQWPKIGQIFIQHKI